VLVLLLFLTNFEAMFVVGLLDFVSLRVSMHDVLWDFLCLTNQALLPCTCIFFSFSRYLPEMYHALGGPVAAVPCRVGPLLV